MKYKIPLLISFLFCYLEWGNNQSSFVFEIIHTIFIKNFNIYTLLHPIIFIGILSFFSILLSLFINIPMKIEKISVGFLVLLVLFFLFIGVLAFRYKIILSTLPFLFFVNSYFLHLKKGSH